jgi:hypothetical protein
MLLIVSRREEGGKNVAIYQAVALDIHTRPRFVQTIETTDVDLGTLH